MTTKTKKTILNFLPVNYSELKFKDKKYCLTLILEQIKKHDDNLKNLLSI